MRTPLCDLLGTEFPIIQAGMGSFTSAELVAAVSNAGGLGSLGASARSIASLKEELARVRELTERPFAVNHTVRYLNKEVFAVTLEAKPALISFAIDSPGELVQQAHDAGIRVMLQVPTAAAAREAVSLGVDVIVAQGAEAGGGFGGLVATLALLPQVVDIAGSTPVVAAGGIADGRGLAAALTLGAQGISIGTRFLASVECPINSQWKRDIVAAQSEDTLKFEPWNDIFPAPADGYHVIPRVLSSSFVKEWMNRRDDARRESERLQEQIGTAIERGTWGELLPFTGQTAGFIHEVLPAGEIVRRIMAEASESLKAATKLFTKQ
ncbi:MAG: nitronate monooxygenase [SAR202 cluster bacterium]|nr:nitronate monooxygenase [SAR202 cluster bacterium]